MLWRDKVLGQTTPLRGCAAAAVLLALVSCRSEQDSQKAQPSTRKPSQGSGSTDAAPVRRLALPPRYTDQKSDGHTVDLGSSSELARPSAAVGTSSRCPPEMVLVASTYCVDRYEASLVDSVEYRPLSPHYPPSRERTGYLFDRWTKRAPLSKRALGRNLGVPAPPAFQLTEDFLPLARSVKGTVPAGYLNRGSASKACESAGKRLCSHQEWVVACRGERQQSFPYGASYRDGRCNVHRTHHPAVLLHGNASKNHLDPRLGLTSDDEGPLLAATGSYSECASEWNGDALYDMVGNLDEWVDDPGGRFVGGFYARATRAGCEASIEDHQPGYYDYSLGVRCCQAAR